MIDAKPNVAKVFAVTIAVLTVADFVFDPKTKWALYSKAADLLAVDEMKRVGAYDEYKSALQIIVATEARSLQNLKDLDEVLRKIHTETETPPPRGRAKA